MKIFFLALSLVLALPAAAQAQNASRTEADCEKIDEALSYNACLAELGPRVGERRPSVAGPATTRRNAVQRRPDGRKAATFDVITGNK